MKKILITGATGFVGKELCSVLSNYYEIIRVVRSEKDLLSDNDVIVPVIDRNTDWSNLLNNVDVIVHLAAKAHDMSYVDNDDIDNIYYETNYWGTKTLVDEAVKSGVKKIIFMSTIKVNGESTELSCFAEEDIPKPVGSYAISKLKAEEYIKSKAIDNDFTYTIIRPTLVFGKNVKGNLNFLMKMISKGLPFPYFKVENKRHMIGLKNLCMFVKYSIESENCNNQVIIVSEKVTLSTKKLVSYISEAMGKKTLFIRFPMFFRTIFSKVSFIDKIIIRLYGNLIVDNNKLYTKINWKPVYTIEEQITEMINEYKKQGELK